MKQRRKARDSNIKEEWRRCLGALRVMLQHTVAVRTLIGAQQSEAGCIERVLKDAVKALARLICARHGKVSIDDRGGGNVSALDECDVLGSLVIEMHSSTHTLRRCVVYVRHTASSEVCGMFCCTGERGALHSSSLDSFVDLRYSMLALSGGGPSSLLVVVIAGARPVGALAVTVFDLAQISHKMRADWQERTAAGGRSFSVINMSAKSALISSSSTYVPDFALAADG